LLSPCACRGSMNSVHLRCLQKAYIAQETLEFPTCPSCKQDYDARVAVMLLEHTRANIGEDGQTGIRIYLAALANLGHAFMLLEAHQQAIKLYEELLAFPASDDILQAIKTPTVLSNMGEACRRIGDFNRALDFLNRAFLSMQEEDALASDQIATLCNLASVHAALGENQQVKEVLERALAIQDAGGIETCAPLFDSLGELQRSLGNYEQAIGFLERAVNAQKHAYGERLLQKALSLQQLGLACLQHWEKCRQHQIHQKAVSCLQEALKIQEREYDHQHSEVVKTRDLLDIALSSC